MIKEQLSKKDAFAYLHTMDSGKVLLADLEERREQAMRMMRDADDCQLRKLAGACAVLTDILDDFEDARPKIDPDF